MYNTVTNKENGNWGMDSVLEAKQIKTPNKKKIVPGCGGACL